MPLRCVDAQGENIHSFELSEEEWSCLKQDNRLHNKLRFPCCDSQVILKTSKLGLRFFSHKAKGQCSTSKETEEHLIIKSLAAQIARQQGWDALTEVSGKTPQGERWRADVLACKGTHKVAVEVQLSSQTIDETIRRQAVYKASGVRGLWLLKQPGFPLSKQLPAVCVTGNKETGFVALLPKHEKMRVTDKREPENWHQSMPLDNFLSGVFAGRLKFISILDAKFRVSVTVIQRRCACKAWCWRLLPIRVLASFSNPEQEVHTTCDFLDLISYPVLARNICKELPQTIADIPLIVELDELPDSRAIPRNKCPNCESLIGNDFLSIKYGEASGLLIADFIMEGEPEFTHLFERVWTDKWHLSDA